MTIMAKHVDKWVSGIQLQGKAQIFDHMELISILGMLHSFQMASDNNRSHEEPLYGCSLTS